MTEKYFSDTNDCNFSLNEYGDHYFQRDNKFFWIESVKLRKKKRNENTIIKKMEP